jgi:hypothetical protein
MDDGDKNQRNIKQREETCFLQRLFFDAGYVFSSAGVRCSVQIYNEYNRILLEGGRRFLLHFRVILAVLYLAYETVK